jgi:HTH-type transcriptional regulator/antitoxin HigA
MRVQKVNNPTDLNKLHSIWSSLQKTASIKPIYSKREYKDALLLLESLLQNEEIDYAHKELIDTLSLFINNYEDEHEFIDKATPIEILKYLMQEHNLKQGDLPELGSQGVISEILTGKRELNKRQIFALATKFGISPAVFL